MPKNSKIHNFYTNSKKFHILTLLYIMTIVVLTYFCLFCSMSNRFRDKNYLQNNGKNSKFSKLWNIFKISNFGALIHYHPCPQMIPNFHPFHSYLQPFPGYKFCPKANFFSILLGQYFKQWAFPKSYHFVIFIFQTMCYINRTK